MRYLKLAQISVQTYHSKHQSKPPNYSVCFCSQILIHYSSTQWTPLYLNSIMEHTLKCVCTLRFLQQWIVLTILVLWHPVGFSKRNKEKESIRNQYLRKEHDPRSQIDEVYWFFGRAPD